MDIVTLCNKIELQVEMKDKVFAFTKEFDFLIEKDMLKLEGFDSWDKVLEYSEKYLGFVYPMIKTNKDCFTYFLDFNSDQ